MQYLKNFKDFKFVSLKHTKISTFIQKQFEGLEEEASLEGLEKEASLEGLEEGWSSSCCVYPPGNE